MFFYCSIHKVKKSRTIKIESPSYDSESLTPWLALHMTPSRRLTDWRYILLRVGDSRYIWLCGLFLRLKRPPKTPFLSFFSLVTPLTDSSDSPDDLKRHKNKNKTRHVKQVCLVFLSFGYISLFLCKCFNLLITPS